MNIYQMEVYSLGPLFCEGGIVADGPLQASQNSQQPKGN